MHSSNRLKTLTASITAKLTPAEEKRVAAAAEAQGVTRSQWLRRTVLNAVSCPPETRLVLSEVLALRALTLALHAAALPNSEALIRGAINHADARKSADADNRIATLQNGERA